MKSGMIYYRTRFIIEDIDQDGYDDAIFPERIIPSSDTLIMRFHVHSGSSIGY